MSVNTTTSRLPNYPMEELTKIKQALLNSGQRVLDFGTGDPPLEIWPPIRQALIDALRPTSQYPSVYGTKALELAQRSYLSRRFGISDNSKIQVLPTRGSKEAIFHIALSVVGRNGRDGLLYPNPGYPVYRPSALFAGGTPIPYTLDKKNSYMLEPWTLPDIVQKSLAAVWVNYPHNPTGAIVNGDYYRRLCEWADKTDTVILSDECYVDIYDDRKIATPPPSILETATKNVIAFFTLSKRSGLTGYRCGFMAGDPAILDPHAKARANFGLAMPDFIQSAAAVAWKDDDHVLSRRKLLADRVAKFSELLTSLGLAVSPAVATFYVWADLPKGKCDIAFCRDLASRGLIASPSSWLGENTPGQVRFAMTEPSDTFAVAQKIIQETLNS